MASLKDYYEALGVEQAAAPEEIKRAYRKLALQYHPDRNPGNLEAEERFKLISESYAVLMDPVKRAQFDRARTAQPGAQAQQESGFAYTQEDIFREFFRSAYARQAFRDLGQEFEKSGFRFDEKFFDHVFFGGRGMFVGGVFFSGPGFQRVHRAEGPAFRTTFSREARIRRPSGAAETVPERPAAKGLLGRIQRFLRRLSALPAPVAADLSADINFNLTISPDQARTGTQVEVVYRRSGQPQRVSVKVPPGTRSGARLRLKGMGERMGAEGSGDLFLHVSVAS